MVISKFWKGTLLTLFAASCWGLVSPLAKLLAAGGLNLLSVMVFRALFTAVCVGVWLVATKQWSLFRVNRDTLRLYFLSGVLSVAMGGGGFLTSLEYLKVAEALVIHYTFPLVALIGSLYITHEKPTIPQAIAGVLIVIGVFIGMGGSLSALSKVSLLGVFWGLIAVAGMAGQALTARKFSLTHNMHPVAVLFWSNVFGFIILFLFKSLHGWDDLAFLTIPLVGIMTLQAFTGSLLAYGAFFAALKDIPAAMSTLLCPLEIVVAVALTALLAGEIPTLRQIIGCALIFAALALTAMPRKYVFHLHHVHIIRRS